ncbi:pyridoxamine 5'-phosphate oxidase family protein [Arthrobacter celericrescens]|uniref:pyridoxamine 5'-phosphate oxidase family protein n=1 Tax=Arthrobacter celericrescens TaxID=2320851 RepID=UPI000EA12E78|nr:pyridoxamine 5'-phosphate oxidase family protein [Arthrobacter celericrescens]
MGDMTKVGKIDFEECYDLLGTGVVGRLAVIVDGHPEIFPVNYVLERRSIVFRTATGKKLWESRKELPAAFEIDGYDPATEEAWSVMVRGGTSMIDDPDEQAAADTLGLEPWQPGPKTHYVRLSPTVLTGRKFKVSAPDVWATRLNDARRTSFE